MPAFAVGDGVREPPPSFTPPHSTSPLSSVQVQTPSAILPVPGSAHSAYIRAADADGTIQDEWVDLTRSLTLLSARGSTELDIDISGSREETMMVGISNTTALLLRLHSSELMASRYSVTCHQNLDELPQPSTHLHPHFQHGVQESPDIYIGHMAPQLMNSYNNTPATGFSSSRVTPPAAVAFLRAPSPPTMPTPPLCSTPLPSHPPFNAARVGTALLVRQEPQQQPLLLPGPMRRSRFTMGPRPDCDKCRLGVPGHYAHFE